MRGLAFVPFLTLWLVLSGASVVRAGEGLQVRSMSVAPGAAGEGRGRAISGSLAHPDDDRALTQRALRWRAFRDRLDAGHTNWSSRAMRRRSWRAPLRRARGVAVPAAIPSLPPPDTLRVAFLRMDFLKDRGGSASVGDGHFDLTGPDTTQVPIDRAPHNRTFFQKHAEALKRYHEAQSYHRTIIDVDVWPRSENGAYHVSDMADFGPWEFSQSVYDAAVHMFRTMMFAADSQSIALGDRVPWDHYDRFVLIHAGSDLQSDVRQDSKEDIPSFTFGVVDSEIVWVRNVSTPGDSFPLDRCSVIPETATQDGFYGAINGVLAHECGHLFYGFFDVYDTQTGLPVVGFWSLMDSGNLIGKRVTLPDGSEIFATGLLPPSIDPLQRSFTNDVMDLSEVSFGDTVAIENSERHPDVRSVRLSSDEFLLLENRYLSPADSVVVLDQDPATSVVLGPKLPDRFEYDSLLPGGGLLIWHIDLSVIPLEYAFPLDTAMRADPYIGINDMPGRHGISVVEADGLGDLGDPGSPFLLGAKFDPFFVGNNTVLSDSTHPNLIPNTGTRPHTRITVLDRPESTMRITAIRMWQRTGWPIRTEFPPGGPQLLAVDADGDRRLEVCWAGGDPSGPDSTALFAVRDNGSGLFGPDLEFAQLDHRPRPVMAALPTGDLSGGLLPPRGPSLFAVSTYADGPDTNSGGGRVWLLDHFGQPLPGWPPHLPSLVTTPPVIAGAYPNAAVLVGCANGRVYAIDTAGTVIATSNPPLNGAISGRLAAAEVAPGPQVVVAAGSDGGDVAVFEMCLGLCPSPAPAPAGWPKRLGAPGFEPDFLWIDFNGAGGSATQTPVSCANRGPQLVVHYADRLWAFCSGGEAMPGWGRSLGDTLVAALGAGDPDGDGFPEVLTQTLSSKIAFINSTGYPSPGWPKKGTDETFRTGSAPLAVDLDGDGRGEVVALNASGILAALGADGHEAPGFPLATGVGAIGSMVVADLDLDGTLDLVAPDHLGRLYAYNLPRPISNLSATSWTMLGGDPGRTSALPRDRSPVAPAAVAGPLVRGSLKAYPNPARRRPVSFAYQLTEPATVEFHILDTSGHEVASFTRAGRPTDNLEIWEPGRLPAGLYVAELRFRGASREHTERVAVALIR